MRAHSGEIRTLEGSNSMTQLVGDTRRPSRFEIDKDERLSGRDHQELVREPVCRALVRHARRPDPANSYEAFE
jgi:hypothetical protein